jgi:hypothetical protein
LLWDWVPAPPDPAEPLVPTGVLNPDPCPH